jgi:predicted enzyme related to lactoylglutathione lyase
MRISVVIDCIDPDGLVPFWEAALGYHLEHSLDQFRVLAPAAGEPVGPVLILQGVPEAKVGKNRVHIDVHPPDVPAHLSLLKALGGRPVGPPVQAFGIWWQTIGDPEGNEVCLVADAESPGGEGEETEVDHPLVGG